MDRQWMLRPGQGRRRRRPLATSLPGLATSLRDLPPEPRLRPFDIRPLGRPVYHEASGEAAEVVVVVPVYNYAGYIEECLDSVAAQDLRALSVVVVDDCSIDGSGLKAIDCLRRHAGRFAAATVIAHLGNQRVSMARNSGIAWSREPFLFMLDADNRLRPPALKRLLEALKVSGAAFAYPQLRNFGDRDTMGIADIWWPERLRHGNYIDNMALLRRDALVKANGYGALADDHGWEDYDLWCRFATLGLEGVFLPEVLCEYRVHGTSRTAAQQTGSFPAVLAELALRYPDLFAAAPEEWPENSP